MGTIITLSVDNFEIEWGKNEFYNNHSRLFLPNDIKKAKYYYADNIVEYKKAYCRQLCDVKPRLELLGYTLEIAEHEYNAVKQDYIEISDRNIGLSFTQFAEFVKSIDLSKIRLSEDDPDNYEHFEFVRENIIGNAELSKVEALGKFDKYDLSEFLSNINPYIILRLLIENPKNLNKELIWRYADSLESGWIQENHLYETVNKEDRYLIITEGSTDTFVIKRAFEILRPDIADFFYYIDMEQNYPFTGTGNLYRFSQGLKSMNILNKVIVIYDNDAEGVLKFNETKNLNLPKNMRVMKLPELTAFNKFSCIGPNGITKENINGRALSIECFLDLNYKFDNDPQVRWRNYIDNTHNYQGSIINKEMFVKEFSKIKRKISSYDFSNLNILLDAIYDECLLISKQ